MESLKKIFASPKAKIVLAAVLLVIILVVWFVVRGGSPAGGAAGKKVKKAAHTETDIIQEEQVGDLKFTNISLITDVNKKDGELYTTFNADVTNVGDSESDVENVYIDLLDKDGNVLTTLVGNVRKGLKPDETRQVTSTTKGDFKNVKAKTIRE